MKIGVYAGGFKPFHTGHFSRLAHAIQDNDMTYLFYGIQQAKPTEYYKVGKKKGTPKPQKGFRTLGGTGRLYDEDIATKAFRIYERAIERMPKVEVIPVLSQAKDASGNFKEIRTPVRGVFSILEKMIEDPDVYEKITVYGDQASMMPYIRSKGFDDLVAQGKIQFGGEPKPADADFDELIDKVQMQDGNARLALKNYYTDMGIDVSDDDIIRRQTVRGTDVRAMASDTQTAQKAKEFLPPFLNDKEKDEILSLLQGGEQLAESRLRELIKNVITENNDELQESKPPGEEAHIYNLYEELSMPLSDILEIGRLALQGKLENVQEKIDGQYIAFTVHDGELRFFSKMSLDSEKARERVYQKITAGGDRGGMTREMIQSKYADRPSVAEGFTIAYNALEPIALQFQDTLFRNGEVVVVTGLLVSANPNTILYDKDGFKFISPISLTGDQVDMGSYNSFVKAGRAATTDAFGMDVVPTAKLKKELEIDDSEIEQLGNDLALIANDAGISVGSGTVGEYVKARIEALLRSNYAYIPDSMVEPVADRFMTGKGKVALALKKQITADEYQAFRVLDKSKARVVAEAIIPLEEIIQRLGIMIINKLDLALTASNHNELLGMVKDVRSAFESGFDFGVDPSNTKMMEDIRVTLARLEANEEQFTTATEGIVFTFNGKTYKLTGLFTPINKLRGFFAYGTASLPMQGETLSLDESLRTLIRHIISEGGNAFGDSAVGIERENVDATLDSLFVGHLRPLGVELYRRLGSTGKKLISGDLDIVIPVAIDKDTKQYKKEIVDKLNQSLAGSGEAKLVGANIGVLYPIQGGQADDYVQVDIMLDQSPDETAWLMSGTGDEGVKGVYRNLMLSHIASSKSKEGNQREKMTISFPGGLQKKELPPQFDPLDSKSKRKWVNVGEKIKDPMQILAALGINMKPEQADTFGDLVSFMSDDQALGKYLDGFEVYISRYLSNDSENAQKALSVLKSIQDKKRSETINERKQPKTLADVMSLAFL